MTPADTLVLSESRLPALERVTADMHWHGEFDIECPGSYCKTRLSVASARRAPSILLETSR